MPLAPIPISEHCFSAVVHLEKSPTEAWQCDEYPNGPKWHAGGLRSDTAMDCFKVAQHSCGSKGRAGVTCLAA
jgi:hypothetical protein